MPFKFNALTSQLDLVNVSTGEIGPQGPQGNQGAQGNQGIQGTLGVDGSQGSQGNQGSRGYQGYQGTNGSNGVQGNQGNIGNQGSQGNQGTQGNQGNQGTKYPWKGEWVTGTAYVINDCVDHEGSGYVCVSDHTSGTWSTDLAYPRWNLLVQMGNQGSQGDIGPQGTQGNQGNTGVQGNQGNIGVQGNQGTQGIQGVQGVQGTQGNQGSIGTQGNQGSQGNQGDQGADSTVAGPQGFQGNQGNQGFQGADSTAVGTQGPQGNQGNNGSNGYQGNQGASVTGPQGVQGNQGSSGTNGVQGSQGNQGTQGAIGSQGSQGVQGSIGSQGNQGNQGNQGSSASVATDSIWDAKGDLVIGTGSNTATRLALGSNGQVLTVNSLATNGIQWISTDGWNSAFETWEYVSVDDPTGVIRVNADVTGKYSAGMRIKFTNATNVIYGIITVVGTYTGGYTSITFLHQIDPTDSLALVLMANSAITLPYYSTQKAPLGFPMNPDSWTVKKTDTTARIESTPSNDTWYNTGTTNCQLTIPIGVWDVSYAVRCDGGGTSTNLCFPKVSLSTSNNSESDSTMTSGSGIVYPSSGSVSYGFYANRSKNLALTSKTLYYLICKVYSGGTISLQFTNDNIGMIIKAICVYL